MLAKKVERLPENDNYRALGLYVCGYTEQKPGEKVLDAWVAGCFSDNFYDALMEIELTQELNTRATEGKTYHLMVSFRPADEAKLNAEVFRDIDDTLAKALGFGEHQRICGIHKNTNNMHMHVAYNMIHPEALTKHEPFRDFYKLSEACRELELKHGITIDMGASKGQEPTRVNQKVDRMEAHSGQQSFQSYVKERKDFILEAAEAAAESKDWQALHESLATRGMLIKHISGGLSIVNPHGKGSIKASGVDRNLSMGNLEKRLGAFEVSQVQIKQLQVVESYQAKPLHHGMERQERAALYAEYKAGIDKRIEALEKISTNEKNAKDLERKHWRQKSESFETNTLLIRKDKVRLQQIAKLHEIEALKKLSDRFDLERDAVKRDAPYSNWNNYLQLKARGGNEAALAILRSQNKEVESERDLGPSILAQRRESREKWQHIQAEIRLNQKLVSKDKRSLISVAKMRQLEELGGLNPKKENPFADFKYEIDAQGIVMFRLASGGSLRDTGKELYFSANDKTAQEAALLFAQAKWGKSVTIDGNKLTADFTPKVEKTLKAEKKQVGHGL